MFDNSDKSVEDELKPSFYLKLNNILIAVDDCQKFKKFDELIFTLNLLVELNFFSKRIKSKLTKNPRINNAQLSRN